MEEPQSIKRIPFQSPQNVILRCKEYVFIFINEPPGFANAWLTFDCVVQSVLNVNILLGNREVMNGLSV